MCQKLIAHIYWLTWILIIIFTLILTYIHTLVYFWYKIISVEIFLWKIIYSKETNDRIGEKSDFIRNLTNISKTIKHWFKEFLSSMILILPVVSLSPSLRVSNYLEKIIKLIYAKYMYNICIKFFDILFYQLGVYINI